VRYGLRGSAVHVPIVWTDRICRPSACRSDGAGINAHARSVTLWAPNVTKFVRLTCLAGAFTPDPMRCGTVRRRAAGCATYSWNSIGAVSSYSIVVTCSPTRRQPREDATRMSGDFSVQLSRAYLIGRPAVCTAVCTGGYSVHLFVWCVVLQIPRARHARFVADKSLASSSDTPDFLVRYLREDVTRMLRVNCFRGI